MIEIEGESVSSSQDERTLRMEGGSRGGEVCLKTYKGKQGGGGQVKTRDS